MPKMNITKTQSRKSVIPRPLNSFMIFRMEHQASVSKEYPGATHQDISKKLSMKWKELTAEERQEYYTKALAAKEEHKLQYPDYKYRPRRRCETPKKIKKSNNSSVIAVQTESSGGDLHPQVRPIDCSNEQLYLLPDTTFFNPLQAVDITINLTNALDDDSLTTTTCFDNLLLCPTLSEPSYQDPSASPSAFSIMSQFSGLSPSLSSDYEPTATLQSLEYYDAMGVHPYYCGPVSNTYTPPPFECASIIDYSQMDQVAMPFDVLVAPIADLMPPQINFPETQHQLPPAILDHTEPTLGFDAIKTANDLSSNSFDTYAPISGIPLLTQPYLYMDFQAMSYRMDQ
ncbi:uncharacterized protein ATC70_002455 [Mucor velutinosus]|uniref:HMG box domain-containing protein n=1 Tax=Mucor velutinosus TaxID=708070 RepID=A0AAN7HSV5_9FUNG|nr:hypothetical protein ATC70_002455 [Mucor velutinosus]